MWSLCDDGFICGSDAINFIPKNKCYVFSLLGDSCLKSISDFDKISVSGVEGSDENYTYTLQNDTKNKEIISNCRLWVGYLIDLDPINISEIIKDGITINSTKYEVRDRTFNPSLSDAYKKNFLKRVEKGPFLIKFDIHPNNPT